MKKILLFIFASLLCVGVKATVLWTGSCTIGNWSGSSVTAEKGAFADAVAGDIIRVTISAYAEKDGDSNDITSWSYQLQQKDNSWQTLTDFTEGTLKKGQRCASYILTSADIATLKAQGLAINGTWITVTKVELLTAGSESLSTTGETLGDGTNWGNYEHLSWGNKGNLANAQKYDCIRVTYTVTAAEAQINIQTVWNGWTVRAEKYDNTYDSEGTNTGKVLTCTISDATILEQIQQAGIVFSGIRVTVTSVDLIKPTDRIDVVPLTIGTNGIATFGSSKHLDFSGTGITPYYATEATTGNITLTPTTQTRAWSGCIVKGSAGSYEIPVTDEVTWQDYMENLKSSGEGGKWVYRSLNDDSKYRYIFAKKGEDIGFYKLAEDYSRVTTVKEGDNVIGTEVYYHVLGAHKAYLETSIDVTPDDPSSAIALIFDDEETTGVNEVRSTNFTNNTNEYFNLAGQRVANPTKGLYIVNGKKVVIK